MGAGSNQTAAYKQVPMQGQTSRSCAASWRVSALILAGRFLKHQEWELSEKSAIGKATTWGSRFVDGIGELRDDSKGDKK